MVCYKLLLELKLQIMPPSSSRMTFLDILPLTRLLETPHMRPSPAMTLMSLCAVEEKAAYQPGKNGIKATDKAILRAGEEITQLKRDLQFWKEKATHRRQMLKNAGIEYGESWDAEDRR